MARAALEPTSPQEFRGRAMPGDLGVPMRMVPTRSSGDSARDGKGSGLSKDCNRAGWNTRSVGVAPAERGTRGRRTRFVISTQNPPRSKNSRPYLTLPQQTRRTSRRKSRRRLKAVIHHHLRLGNTARLPECTPACPPLPSLGAPAVARSCDRDASSPVRGVPPLVRSGTRPDQGRDPPHNRPGRTDVQ